VACTQTMRPHEGSTIDRVRPRQPPGADRWGASHLVPPPLRGTRREVSGWIVLRFWSCEVVANLEGVLGIIADAIEEHPPRPNLMVGRSPRSAGGQKAKGLASLYVPPFEGGTAGAKRRRRGFQSVACTQTIQTMRPDEGSTIDRVRPRTTARC
jgi:hypothetical protein